MARRQEKGESKLKRSRLGSLFCLGNTAQDAAPEAALGAAMAVGPQLALIIAWPQGSWLLE